jgi:hypothetical protein
MVDAPLQAEPTDETVRAIKQAQAAGPRRGW